MSSAIINFEHKEIVEMLIKKSNLHEGIWGLGVGFSTRGAISSFPPENTCLPTLIIGITNICLTKKEQLDDLSLDAADVNPIIKPNPFND